jgi:hypothetical protein
VKFVENGDAVGLNNVTRVMQVVAPHDTDMAKLFTQKIAARKDTFKQAALLGKSPVPGADAGHSVR